MYPKENVKQFCLCILAIFHGIVLSAGIVEKTFYFHNIRIDTIRAYQKVRFGNTVLSGIPGEPLLPYHKVVLMLPPGEIAVSINVTGENEVSIPGSYVLFPQQQVQPISKETSGDFIKNEKVYSLNGIYPAQPTGKLLTQYLNGYAFALSSFTPVKYIPLTGKISYYGKITIRITTKHDARSVTALQNLPGSAKALARVRNFAQNPEIMEQYPQRESPVTGYQLLIIAPSAFADGFQPLISMYDGNGISANLVTTETITNTGTGSDLQEKIRNYIISEYQSNNIEYVLLGGNPPNVPYRGFYCYVASGGGYEDSNIPADLYFSGLDGNYNADGDFLYGELNDDPDLLPEVAVARFTVNDTAELNHMVHKSVSYQTNPVFGEFTRPLLAGEYLYDNPLTFGGDYMDLLIDDHNDNGYFTHGIPSATNDIEKLYDTLTSPPANIWYWNSTMLLASINQGKSFIHHLGHSNTTYMMRLYTSQITNANFAGVDGITHNYQVLYTQGCYCGAFDGGCIAAKAVTINNFLAGGIFNSRYGWFNQGTTDGPSQHLQREFVSALYNETLPEKHLGTAHMISKINTAPWVSLPGEFEPGAQLWCHYCCNAFGDPAMEIWTEEPATFTNIVWTGNVNSDWNNPGNWNLGKVPTSLYNVTIPQTSHNPVITTCNSTFCHDLIIQNDAQVNINPGKSLIVRGTVILNGTD